MELLPKEFTQDIIAKETPMQKLDDAGVPIFDDIVEMYLSRAELYTLHKLIGVSLTEYDIVPMPEGPAMLSLLDKLAEQEKTVTETKTLTLPPNYLLGLGKFLTLVETVEIWREPNSPISHDLLVKLKTRCLDTVLGYSRIKASEKEEIPSPSHSTSLLTQNSK